MAVSKTLGIDEMHITDDTFYIRLSKESPITVHEFLAVILKQVDTMIKEQGKC